MSWQEIGMLALGVIVSGLSWALKTLYAENTLLRDKVGKTEDAIRRDMKDEDDQLRRDFSSLSLKIVSEYVHKNDLAEFKTDIREMFRSLGQKIDNLVEKIDSKADK